MIRSVDFLVYTVTDNLVKRKLRWAGGREWVQDRHNLYSLCSDQVIELGRGFGASKEMLAKLRMLGESLGAY